MKVVSAGSAPWVISAGDPAGTLEIVLQKQTVVLSWHQFVYAEGDSEQVRIAFASHDVVISGAGLDPLLSAIASHKVVSRRGSSVKSWYAGSRVSYEANVRDVDFRVAF